MMVLCIIQARMNSSRLPGKVILPFAGSSIIECIHERVRRSKRVNEVVVGTSIESSEIIKYASNSFLATKIAFINEVADLCEKVEANVQDVAKAMGLDNRIGSKFLNVSPGYGGSCFPKDVRAFSENAKKYGVDLSIIRTVDHSNTQRIMKIASQIIDKLGNNLDKKEVVRILDNCLLSDHDMLQGKNHWKNLPDPFPVWGESS